LVICAPTFLKSAIAYAQSWFKKLLTRVADPLFRIGSQGMTTPPNPSPSRTYEIFARWSTVSYRHGKWILLAALLIFLMLEYVEQRMGKELVRVASLLLP